MLAEICALREILPKQAVGILVAATLPRAMRVTETDWQPREDRQVRMPRHLRTLIPSERPAKWRRKGDWKCESLWSLLSSNFKAFLEASSFQDEAGLVLRGIVLARGAANIANQPFGRHPLRWGGAFLAHLHSTWGYDEPEILRYEIRQVGPIGAYAEHAV